MELFLKLFSKLFSNSLSNELFIHAFKDSPVASLIVSMDGEILEVNSSLLKLMGYAEQELMGANMSLFKSFKHDNAFYKNLWNNLRKVSEYSFEVINRDKYGKLLDIKEQVKLIKCTTQSCFIIAFEDITEQKIQEKRQHYLATHDPLTGLANRALLKDRYEHAILNAVRHHTQLAVMVCDLNGFKEINDNYGHNFGDEVLKEVSKRLDSLTRESDTVARYGGDEFILILEHVESISLEEMKNNILNRLTFDLKYNEDTCHVNTAIGYSCFPSDGTRFEQLISVADSNMYDAKREYHGF